jgi:hypothetical protein
MCARWLLQVPSSAGAAEIRVAWRRKSMLTHPDKLKDAPGGLQASQRVNEARRRTTPPPPPELWRGNHSRQGQLMKRALGLTPRCSTGPGARRPAARRQVLIAAHDARDTLAASP